jgi:hypothetical protein
MTISNSKQLQQLRKLIMACGAPDKYIDADELAEILQAGTRMGIETHMIDAVLNQMRLNNNWTLENEIIADLIDQLQDSARHGGIISQKRFEHCVNYAVQLNMPRQRAVEISVEFIVTQSLKTKKNLFQRDWFSPLRKSYLKRGDSDRD